MTHSAFLLLWICVLPLLVAGLGMGIYYHFRKTAEESAPGGGA